MSNQKESNRKSDIQAVLILATLLVGTFGIWWGVENFYFNSLSTEGQMKIYTKYLKTLEFECTIENAVPNNIYTGGISMKNRAIIGSPYLMINGHDMNEEQKMEVAQIMIEKVEALPCYKEFLELVEYDSIRDYLMGRL